VEYLALDLIMDNEGNVSYICFLPV
jgi:hypothetical protein